MPTIQMFITDQKVNGKKLPSWKKVLWIVQGRKAVAQGQNHSCMYCTILTVGSAGVTCYGSELQDS